MSAMRPRPANRASRERNRRGAAAPWPSSAATAVAVTSRRRKNYCSWWAAANPRPSLARSSARIPRNARRECRAQFQSLNELAAFLNHAVGGAPRHDRHRGGRVLRRAVDQPIRIYHVDQHIPLGVTAAHDLHFLEEQRASRFEHIVALPHFVLETDRADLPAGQRNIRDLLGEPQ